MSLSDEAAALAGRKVEQSQIGAGIREVFGSPFHPVTIMNSWLTWHDGTISKLAGRIYDDRAFDRMPVLADALEDAGCDDADILDHCRSDGPHVRGCWVVDLLTGRS